MSRRNPSKFRTSECTAAQRTRELRLHAERQWAQAAHTNEAMPEDARVKRQAWTLYLDYRVLVRSYVAHVPEGLIE